LFRLLARNRFLSIFLWGVLMSTIGTSISSVSLPLFVLLNYNHHFILGLVFVAREVPSTILAPWIGKIVDRIGAYRATVIAMLICGVATGLIPFIAFSPVFLLICVFVLGMGLNMLAPTVAVYIPKLTTDQHLDEANGAFQVIWSVGSLVGTATGGGLVALGHYAFAFYLDSATYFFALGTILLIPKPKFEADGEEVEAAKNGFRDVLRVLRNNRSLLKMIVVEAGIYFLSGIGSVALPLYLTHVLHHPWVFSVALVTTAVGDILAGLFSGYLIHKIPVITHPTTYAIVAITVGGGYVLLFLVPSVFLLLTVVLVDGFLIGVFYVVYQSRKQRSVPDRTMGKFQTMISGFGSVFTGGGSIVAGIIRSPLNAYLIGGLAVFAFSVLSLFGPADDAWHGKK
jgi:MFS family permease